MNTFLGDLKLEDLETKKAIAAICIKMTEELILFQYLSQDGSIAHDPMLTNYYIRAILHTGLSNDSHLVQKLRDWYSDMAEKNSQFDPFLLEGLIMLEMENVSYVHDKINELKTFRNKKGRIEIPVGYIMQGDLFSTMFTLRILFYLKDKSLFGTELIEQSLNWVLEHRNEINPLKDKALPIYLLSIYDSNKHQKIINKLLEELQSDLSSIKESFNNQLIKQEESELNRSIEPFLWIIYDLLPLRHKNTSVEFYIKDAVNLISKYLFNYYIHYTDQYDDFESTIYSKTRIYSLFVCIFSQYYQSELPNLINNRLLELSSEKKLIEYLEYQNDKIMPFITIIKKWFNIDLKAIKQLTGGYSDSKIYKIKPVLQIPIVEQEYNLPSIICKISSRDNFRKELDSFKTIPENLKHFFSKLSENTILYEYGDQSKISLLIEDLLDYETMKEVFDRCLTKGEKENSTLKSHLNYLCANLEFIYTNSLKETSIDLIPIYYADIMKSVTSLTKLSFPQKTQKLPVIIDIITSIYRKLSEGSLSFKTFMHGDLNLRNIMVLETKGDYRYKFIDYDNLTLDGDYTYDIGELLVDIQAYSDEYDFISLIENKFSDLSKKFVDNSYEERLKIAKFRSWIKLAKVFLMRNDLKNGTIYLDNGINIYS